MNEEYKSNQEKSETKINELLKTILEQEKTISHLNKKEIKENRYIEKYIPEMKNELSDYKKKLEEANMHMMNMQAKLDEYKSIIKQKEEFTGEVQDQAKTYEKRLRNKDETISSLKMKIFEFEKSISDYEVIIDQKLIQELNLNLSKKEKETKHLLTENSNMQQLIEVVLKQELKQSNDDNDMKYSTLQKYYDTNIEKCKVTEEKLKKDIEKYKEKLANEKKIRKESNNAIVELNQKLVSFESKLSKELAYSKETNSVQQEEISNLKQNIDDIINDANSRRLKTLKTLGFLEKEALTIKNWLLDANRLESVSKKVKLSTLKGSIKNIEDQIVDASKVNERIFSINT